MSKRSPGGEMMSADGKAISARLSPEATKTDDATVVPPSIARLRLTEIEADPSLMMRVQVDARAVDEYASKFAREMCGDLFPNEKPFPRCVVFELETGKRLLAHGWHRFPAMQKAGIEAWDFDLYKGTIETAATFAASANKDAACVRYTNADKVNACRRLFAILGPVSSRHVAELAGVDHKTAEKCRPDEYKALPRTGKDKKNYEVKARTVTSPGEVPHLGMPTADFLEDPALLLTGGKPRVDHLPGACAQPGPGGPTIIVVVDEQLADCHQEAQALQEFAPVDPLDAMTAASVSAAARSALEAEVRTTLNGGKGDASSQPSGSVLRQFVLPRDGTSVRARVNSKMMWIRWVEDSENGVVIEVLPGSHPPSSRPIGPTLGAEAEKVSEPGAGDVPEEPIQEARYVHLSVVADNGRAVDDGFLQKEVARGAWRPYTVVPSVSGLSRPMTIMLAERKTDLVKWAYHGDESTFCPPLWADLAIGSGACGFGCRSCFLMLTFRSMRDPLRPVIYDNGDDFERAASKWLLAQSWKIDGKGVRPRTARDAIGLGIDCSDSLLWEGVTGHARRLIPLFTNAASNPRGNLLILLTKSANTHYLEQIASLRRIDGKVPNVAVTMSLNPEDIADLWEGKFPDTLERITPPISRRLEALRVAQDLGFEVRARIDPVLTPDGWEDAYAGFFADIAHKHGIRPSMLTLGSHREKTPQLDTWRVKWGMPALEWEAPKTPEREGTHIHMAGRAAVYNKVRALAASAFSGTGMIPLISLCKETHDVRRDAGFCNADCNCLPVSAPSKRHLLLVK